MTNSQDVQGVVESTRETVAVLASKLREQKFSASAQVLENSFETIASLLLPEHEGRVRAEALVYVPGVLRCAKCQLRLVTSTLNATTGQVAANNAPQPCPNGCGPLWRITERDAGNDLCDRLSSSQARVEGMERALIGMVDAFWPDPGDCSEDERRAHIAARQALAKATTPEEET